MQGFIGAMHIYLKHAGVLLAVGALLQLASAHSPGQGGAHHAAPLQTERDAPQRPHVTRIDHVTLYSSNLEASRTFYTQALGLPSDGSLGCVGNTSSCFPVNDRQQIELERAPSSAPKSWVAEIGYATDNVEQMRRYLLAHNVTVTPVTKGVGEKHVEANDPEGHRLSFVERTLHVTDWQSFSNQVAIRLYHAGFVVKDRRAESRFYQDSLGFKLYWYGGFQDDGVDWYEIQVPDGSDWIEYMLNIPANADHKELGIQNHFSLGVKDIRAAADQLRKNGLTKFDGPEIGRDGKWALDAYDPDGTRVEFMEPTPAGKPCCHPYTAPHPQL